MHHVIAAGILAVLVGVGLDYHQKATGQQIVERSITVCIAAAGYALQILGVPLWMFTLDDQDSPLSWIIYAVGAGIIVMGVCAIFKLWPELPFNSETHTGDQGEDEGEGEEEPDPEVNYTKVGDGGRDS